MLEKYLRRAQEIGLRLPHLLLIGGSQQSRAAVAKILARRAGVSCQTISSDQILRPCDMAAHLIGLDRGILFLDEIDKLELGAGEILHCAIIEGYVPIVLEEWGTVRDKEIELSPFTVIAASSHVELVAERVGKLFANELYLV